MAINLVTKTAEKVAERLSLQSVTQGIFSNQYSFVGAKSIEVFSVDTVPLTTYDNTLKDGSTAGTIGNRFGQVTELGDTKNTYTMGDRVKYNIGTDVTNDTDQNEIKKSAASIISRQTREIVVPYMDKYRLNKLAAGAGLNKYSATVANDLGSAKIVRTLLTAKAALGNNLAPANQQVLYIGETNAIEMKLADQVIGIDKVAEKPIVNGVLDRLAGMQLRIVPDTYMPEDCAFLIVTKGSAWAPEKVKISRVITDPEDYAGKKVQFLMYHDCFVNAVRKNTIYACWTSAAPTGN